MGQGIFSSPCPSLPVMRPSRPLVHWVLGLFPGVKRPKRGVDYPPLSSAGVRHDLYPPLCPSEVTLRDVTFTCTFTLVIMSDVLPAVCGHCPVRGTELCPKLPTTAFHILYMWGTLWPQEVSPRCHICGGFIYSAAVVLCKYHRPKCGFWFVPIRILWRWTRSKCW